MAAKAVPLYTSGRVLDGRTYDAMPDAAEPPASGLFELEPSVAFHDKPTDKIT